MKRYYTCPLLHAVVIGALRVKVLQTPTSWIKLILSLKLDKSLKIYPVPVPLPPSKTLRSRPWTQKFYVKLWDVISVVKAFLTSISPDFIDGLIIFT